jgi:FlaA1/EpsC-like NDP-sugar epimerase
MRIVLLWIVDITAILFSGGFALYARFDFQFGAIRPEFWRGVLLSYPFNILITMVVFGLFHLYQTVWRYASEKNLMDNAFAVFLCALSQPLVFWILKIRMPISYPFMYGFFLLILTAGFRFSYRIFIGISKRLMDRTNAKSRINCMIIGAGSAGNLIIKEIESSQYIHKKVCCVIDDNPNCQGKLLRGIPIVGGREAIASSVKKYEIHEIIIAIPSAGRAQLKPIIQLCKETHCHLRLLPGMYQILNGDVNVTQLREVSIEDLLGRDAIEVNVQEIMSYVRGKTVLVTGAGGSIGSELCRQLAIHEPTKLLLLDISENGLYDIQQELIFHYPMLQIVTLVASICNERRLEQIFREYRPQIIYHAAAKKHVPLMEDNPNEAVRNNVFGTYTLAHMADTYQVERFVLISTDKAVNPTNVMGATKRICEMIIQDLNRTSTTIYTAVRFGNVLGSSGSVIPLFKKQIDEGGPVTITHPDIVRYFMTIPEAVSLVLQAGAYAQGGEIFVLDMGEPIRIVDLAKTLIQLSGYRVDEDISIKFIGLRPGEKLFEELFQQGEDLAKTPNKLIFIGQSMEFDSVAFRAQLDRLYERSQAESPSIREVLTQIVPGYEAHV